MDLKKKCSGGTWEAVERYMAYSNVNNVPESKCL
jgi:hypothetical protein